MTPIVAFIDRVKAKQKLTIAVQEIDHRPIAEAVVRARQRKVTVDVVIDDALIAAHERGGKQTVFWIVGWPIKSGPPRSLL